MAALAQPQADGLRLAKNGVAQLPIVLAEDAIPAEKTAALELQKYLHQVTGAEFPVREAAAVKPTAPQILVGAGHRVKNILPGQDWEALGQDGIVIKTVQNKLILAGGRPRGALYAVYQFLEDSVGCHWWTPTESTVPRKSTLELPLQNTVYIPPFDYRENFITAAEVSPVFATTLRENGHAQPQSPEWGGHYSILGWCHTFSQLLPPATYFKEHPEWYSDPLNNFLPCTAASPLPDHTQLCVTNPEVIAEIGKQALKWVEANPEAGYISISENDGKGYCRCPRCTQAAEAEGSQAGPNLMLTNAVATEIGKKYPHFLIETLAYNDTENPPKTVRPASNVIIRLAPINSDFGHPLNSDWNKRTRDNLLQWAKISPRLFIWNYVTNFNAVMLPHPNWSGLAEDLRFFAANKVTGVFAQGDTSTNGVGDFAQLRAWLLGKLMWNPNANQEELTNQFLDGYYGPAAPHLKKYLDVMHRAFLQQNRALSTFNEDFTFFTLQTANQATRHFNEAAQAVEADEVLSARVSRERLSLDAVWIRRYRPLRKIAMRLNQEFEGPADGQVALQEFITAAQGLKIRDFRENGSFAAEIPRLQSMVAPEPPLPDFAFGIPASEIIDVPAENLNLLSASQSLMVDDAAASNGKAATMVGSTREWLIQLRLNQVLEPGEQSQWRVYIMARATAHAGAAMDGTAIHLGLYDPANRALLIEKPVALNVVAGPNYKAIDMGIHTLDGDDYFWVGGEGNADTETIYIDRVILIREKA